MIPSKGDLAMHRFLTLAVIGMSLAAIAITESRENSAQEKQAMLKAVVHVNFGDAERQDHGLKNIENILKEVGDAQIEVVCHGDGITLVEKKAKLADSVQALVKKGVRFVACENTMKKKSLGKEDLVTGTDTVPSGAVEVIRKQSEGYGYFRP